MGIHNEQMIGSLAAAPSAEAVAEMQKGLTGGYGLDQFNTNVPGDGSVIRTEQLEDTLKVTTFKAKDIKLWPMIDKKPTYSAVDQHAEISSYGQNPEGGFFAEGGSPAPEDETYVRRYDAVKFIGVQKSVSHQFSLQKVITSEPIALSTVAGTMALLRKLELALLTSDSSLSALQTDSFPAQIMKKSNAENIIDLRGAPITEDLLINMSTVVKSAPNFGQLTDIMVGTRVRADIQRSFIPRERTDAFVQTSNGIISKAVNGIDVDGGVLNLHGNPFIDDGGIMPLTQVGSSQAVPLAPVISTPVSTPSAANSQFASSDAGNYYVFVRAANSAGFSAPVQVSSAAIAVAGGQVIQFGVTPAPGSNPVEWFEIFRSPSNGLPSSVRRTLRVPNTNPNTGFPMATENTIVDSNLNIPGCTYGLGLQMDGESLGVKLLCPLLRIPLAITSTSIPYLLVSYFAIKLYAPNRAVYLRNVGRLPTQSYTNA